MALFKSKKSDEDQLIRAASSTPEEVDLANSLSKRQRASERDSKIPEKDIKTTKELLKEADKYIKKNPTDTEAQEVRKRLSDQSELYKKAEKSKKVSFAELKAKLDSVIEKNPVNMMKKFGRSAEDFLKDAAYETGYVTSIFRNSFTLLGEGIDTWIKQKHDKGQSAAVKNPLAKLIWWGLGKAANIFNGVFSDNPITEKLSDWSSIFLDDKVEVGEVKVNTLNLQKYLDDSKKNIFYQKYANDQLKSRTNIDFDTILSDYESNINKHSKSEYVKIGSKATDNLPELKQTINELKDLYIINANINEELESLFKEHLKLTKSDAIYGLSLTDLVNQGFISIKPDKTIGLTDVFVRNFNNSDEALKFLKLKIFQEKVNKDILEKEDSILKKSYHLNLDLIESAIDPRNLYSNLSNVSGSNNLYNNINKARELINDGNFEEAESIIRQIAKNGSGMSASGNHDAVETSVQSLLGKLSKKNPYLGNSSYTGSEEVLDFLGKTVIESNEITEEFGEIKEKIVTSNDESEVRKMEFGTTFDTIDEDFVKNDYDKINKADSMLKTDPEKKSIKSLLDYEPNISIEASYTANIHHQGEINKDIPDNTDNYMDNTDWED